MAQKQSQAPVSQSSDLPRAGDIYRCQQIGASNAAWNWISSRTANASPDHHDWNVVANL